MITSDATRRPLHVAHVVPRVDEAWGGPAMALRQITSRLADEGISSSIWTTGSKDDDANAGASSAFPSANVHVYPVETPRGWFYSPALARGLASSMTDIDIVHIHGLWTYPHFVAARIGARCSKPVILRPAGQLEPWLVSHKGIKKAIYLKTFGVLLSRCTTLVQAMSEMEKANILSSGLHRNVVVVPHGINLPDFEELASERIDLLLCREGLERDRYVLALGRLSPQKGLDVLISAWEQMSSNPMAAGWALVLAGPDFKGYEAKLRSLAQRSGNEARIVFTGAVSGERKRALLQGAGVFAAPSRGENFGIAIAEAAYAGLPILTSDRTPWSDLTNSGGGITTTFDASEVYAGLRAMISHERAVRKEMGVKAREYIHQHYDIGNIVGRWRDMYLSVGATSDL